MPNITLTVDEPTYRAARIAAAQRNASVSALVREYLQSLTVAVPDDRSAGLFRALDKARGFSASERLSRDEAHDRSLDRQ
jgi:hypothetical protein